jgi:hypothetical protein
VDRLDAPTSAEDNVVSHNVANSRFDDGILVGPGSRETLAERNVAFGSGDDGIDIDATDTIVGRNLAFGNTDRHRSGCGRHRRAPQPRLRQRQPRPVP